MFASLYERLGGEGAPSVIIISVAVILFAGFALTRLTKRLKLPNVTAYILAGVLIGPFCLRLVPAGVISGMGFIADVALAFIAFGTGEFFRVSTLKKNGPKVFLIAAAEALTCAVPVFVITWFCRQNFAFSMILSAISIVVSPGSIMMNVRQTESKGDYVDTLLLVVATDSLLGLLAFSVALSVVGGGDGGGFLSVARPVFSNLGILLLGGVFGVLMKWLMFNRSNDNRLIVSVALLFAFCGIATAIGISPLLGCMSMGTVYFNLTEDDKLFKQLYYFSPPILLLFFVRSGMNLRLDALVGGSAQSAGLPLLAVAAIYLGVRFVGKYVGVFLGCSIVKKPKKVRNYLGIALITQASVSIGLASIASRTEGLGDVATAVETVIIAAGVLAEIIGPVCSKLGLYLSGSYSDRLEELAPEPEASETLPPVELLIRRISAIQKDLPKHKPPEKEDEEAFSEAAEEQFRLPKNRRRY